MCVFGESCFGLRVLAEHTVLLATVAMEPADGCEVLLVLLAGSMAASTLEVLEGLHPSKHGVSFATSYYYTV